MHIVDTHTHASPYWFEPIESLLFQMDTNGVERTVLTGITGQTAERYNRYLLECAQRFPGRVSPMVVVDHTQDDAPAVLKQLVAEGAQGVRFAVDDRSPGRAGLAIWKACADLGIPASVQAHTKEEFASDAFRQLIEQLPELTVIIEHLGKAKAGDKPPYNELKKTLSLAEFPNAYLKIGGLGEICKRPFPFRDPFYEEGGIPPYVRMAYDAFGPERMMWGSNFPPSSRVEGYANTLRLLRDHVSDFASTGDTEWIFGKTALKLFPFA